MNGYLFKLQFSLVRKYLDQALDQEMAILQDYEVVIAARPSQEGFIEKCAGRVFREWPDPKAITGGESELVENYIKSIPGMKYQIQVYLKPSFDLFEADEVWVQLIVDCGRVYACETFTKSQVMENKTKKEPFILQYMYTQEGMNYYRNFFTFGNLMSGELFHKKRAIRQDSF